MRNSLRRTAAAFLLALLVATGCTASPENDPQADLRARVAAVRAAVEARDPETARSALNGLRDAVLEHRLNGDIDFERARSITTAANHVEEHLGELDKPPPTEEPDDEDQEEAGTSRTTRPPRTGG